MRIVIAYESMFGNTRLIAEAVAKGLQGHDVRVLPLATAEQGLLERADLLVVGAPTHVHGMSRPSSRKSAGELAAKPASGVTLEPNAPVHSASQPGRSSIARGYVPRRPGKHRPQQ